MAGKLYFITKREESFDNIEYIDFDRPSDWFYTYDSCDSSASSKVSQDQEGVSVKYFCESMCFCKLYRRKIFKCVISGRFRRAYVLFLAGLERMRRSKNGM